MRCFALALLAPVALAAAHAAGVRGRLSAGAPVITGCLAACGHEDQACVTDCQVCVERHHCAGLAEARCKPCLGAAKAARAAAKHLDGRVLDSGGASLAHDGVERHLERSRLEAHHGEIRLRDARGAVLDAQRAAEWARAERREDLKAVKVAKGRLQAKKEEAAQHRARSEGKLRDLRVHKEVSHSEEAAARAELKRSQAALDRLKARGRSRVEDEDEQWALQQKVEKNKRRVEKIEAKLQASASDAGYLNRHMQKEVREAEKDVSKRRRILRHALQTERFQRAQLEDAMKRYRKSTRESQRLDARVVKLERKLRASPLPTRDPPQVLEMHRKARCGTYCSGAGQLPAPRAAAMLATIVVCMLGS